MTWRIVSRPAAEEARCPEKAARYTTASQAKNPCFRKTHVRCDAGYPPTTWDARHVLAKKRCRSTMFVVPLG